MSENKKNELSRDIESLNLEELDIEELEHRLELAAASTAADPEGCYIHSGSEEVQD